MSSKTKTKKIDKGVLKRVLKYAAPHSGYLVMAVLSAVISVVLTLYAPILIGDGVDCIVGKSAVDFEELKKVILLLVPVVLLTAITQWLLTYFTNKTAYMMVRDIRSEAFANIQRLPLKYIDSKQYGEIMSRVVNDAEQISDGLVMGFSQFFTGFMTIAGTLVFMVMIEVRIALIVVLITPISLFAAGFVAKNTFTMFKLQSETRGELTSDIDEMIGNQKLVRAFSYENTALENFKEINERLRKHGLKATFFSSITNPTTRFVNGLVYAGVGVFGAISVINGFMTVGNLSSFLTYANQYTKPFNEMSGVLAELQNAFACAARVFDIIDEIPESADREDAVALSAFKGEVEFKNVSFSYKPETPLMKNVSFSVKPGEHVAIVGPTGCGKTTLINLLMRFYEVTEGSIMVDGMDIRNIRRDSLRENIGMVLQDTWLKTGTIRENIAYGREEATDEEIIAAAKAAHAHSFISRLPKGYDTKISDESTVISQGQKQLLCIAKAMLTNPSMLILDEATSSIDTLTEVRVQKAFEAIMKGRTSFIVAHRLSTIKGADCILVMNDGNIVEHGTHEELIKRDGFYAKLHKSREV